MKVRIYIPADVALLAGSDYSGYHVVDVRASQLTVRQREWLAEHTRSYHLSENPRDPIADLYWDKGFNGVEPTHEAIVANIEQRLADDERKQMEQEAKDAERLSYMRDEIASAIHEKNTTTQEKSAIEGQYYPRYNALRCALPYGWQDIADEAAKAAIDAWQYELATENERRRHDAVTRHEAKQAEEEAAAESAARDRALWIAKHGSDRLQACEAAGIECSAIYRDERLAAERPDWKYDDVSTDDPRNPPADALNSWLEARKQYPNCTLRYVSTYRPATEDELDDPDVNVDSDGDVRIEFYCLVDRFLDQQIVLSLE